MFWKTRIARELLIAGVRDLGDSRIENIEAMRRSRVSARMSLIRSPMLSQAGRVVKSVDVSFNTELEVIRRLAFEAAKLDRTHAVILMVELGDLREGLLPVDLIAAVREVLSMPNIVLKGLGTNLACRSGVSPDDRNMGKLSRLVVQVEMTFDISLETVSGGNSANLDWAFSSSKTGRVNNLRLGESILLGREALHRRAIDGLHTDAITLTAEVIESNVKPTQPTGVLAQAGFCKSPECEDRGNVTQSILAIGEQDVDLGGLQPPEGCDVHGGSSDHLIVTSGAGRIAVGTELTFKLNYGAMLRAMTSPFVAKSFHCASNVSNLRQIA